MYSLRYVCWHWKVMKRRAAPSWGKGGGNGGHRHRWRLGLTGPARGVAVRAVTV
jgi:hypothetical protein